MSRINLTDFVEGVVTLENNGATLVAANAKVLDLNPVEVVAISTWLRLSYDKKFEGLEKESLTVNSREFVFKEIDGDKLEAFSKQMVNPRTDGDVGMREYSGEKYHAFTDAHVALCEKGEGNFVAVCFFHLIAPKQNDLLFEIAKDSAEAVMDTIVELFEAMRDIPRVLEITEGPMDSFKILPLIYSKDHEEECTFVLFNGSMAASVKQFAASI